MLRPLDGGGNGDGGNLRSKRRLRHTGNGGVGIEERGELAAPGPPNGRDRQPRPRPRHRASPAAECAAIPCAAPRRWPRGRLDRAGWRGRDGTGHRHRGPNGRDSVGPYADKLARCALLSVVSQWSSSQSHTGKHVAPRSIKSRQPMCEMALAAATTPAVAFCCVTSHIFPLNTCEPDSRDTGRPSRPPCPGSQ